MGQRGPQPKPANVHLLHGNPSKKPLAALLDEFKPEVEIPDCPGWLWPEAKKEFKRITPELERYGLISLLDRSAIVRYCQAWAEYVWAKKMLARDMKAAEQRRGAFEAAEDAKVLQAEKVGDTYIVKPWTGGDGFMIPTPNGSFTYSPYWVAAKRAGDEVDKCLMAFGLSPAARARVRQSDNYPFLPGMEPGQGEKGGEQNPGTSKLTLAQLAR